MPSNPNTTCSAWVNARSRTPEDYCPVLCIVELDDMGQGGKWPAVLHYDFKDTKQWYTNDPSACAKGHGHVLSDWHRVLFWKPINWPTAEDWSLA